MGLLQSVAPTAIEGLLRQFRDAHANGDNGRAIRILDSIIVQIEQASLMRVSSRVRNATEGDSMGLSP